MDEAVSAVCAYDCERLGLDRISWRAHVGNLGSAAIARRAGLRYEGRMRLGAIQRGARIDQWTAGRSASDGPPTPEGIADAAATCPPATLAYPPARPRSFAAARAASASSNHCFARGSITNDSTGTTPAAMSANMRPRLQRRRLHISKTVTR